MWVVLRGNLAHGIADLEGPFATELEAQDQADGQHEIYVGGMGYAHQWVVLPVRPIAMMRRERAMTFGDDDDYPELSDLLPLEFAPLRDELRRPWWLDRGFADLDRLLPEDMEDE